MPAFSSLGQLSGYLEGRPEVRVVDAPVPLSHFFDGHNDYGPAWKSQPAVRKVVGFIARHLASLPLHVYDRVSDTDRQRVRDHALAQVVARPSRAPAVTRYRFWESLLIDGLLNDRWAAMKVRLSDGGLEMVRVPAYRTRFNADGVGRIDSVSVWTNGKEAKLDPAKFVLDAGYAERGGNGTSPLLTMQHLLDEAREAVEYRRQVWKRGARVPAVVERDKDWPRAPGGSGESTARARFIASLSAFQRGGGQEGATLLLEDGMKYKPADTFAPQQVGDLEGRKLTDIEVCSSYFIAPELLGIREGNYSNVDAYRQMLWGVSLGPYIVAWEQAVNAALVPELADGTDLYIEANVDAKLRGSFEDQAKYLQTATGAPYLTRNEGRSRLNLPAIDGGDDLVVPLNVLVGGQASPTDSGTQNQRSGRPRSKTRAPQTYETKYGQVLQAFFGRQRAAVVAKLGSKAGPDWWDQARWDSELAADLYRLATLTAMDVGAKTAEDLGFEATDYDPDVTLAFLLETTKRSAAGINQATLAAIEAKITALDEDQSPTDAAASVFDVAEGSRAAQIAVAAVTTISGFATLEAGKQVGAGTKTWLTGSNPRTTHARMDGETVALDEPFSNGLMWPGDSAGDADDLANCNCELVIST